MARTKKEFSKEAMYKKIMPSMLRGTEENTENTNTEVDDTYSESINDIINNNIIEDLEDLEDLKDKGIDFVESAVIAQKDTDEGYSTVEDKATSIDNNINDNDEKKTVNFIEILVRNKLDSVLDKFKCCKCQSCKNDIVAIALNNLPVYYYSGNKNEIEEAFKEFRFTNNIDVVTEIIKAIITIRKKEKH